MAFIKEFTNLQLASFDFDELNDMLYWYIFQRGDAKELPAGTSQHFFDKQRKLHWFSYFETTDGTLDNSTYHVDVHYDTGATGDNKIELGKSLAELTATEEARFDSSVPAIWHVGEKKLPIMVELANKNDIIAVPENGLIDVNLNMVAMDATIIHSKKDYAALKKHNTLAEIGKILPTGAFYAQILAEGDAEKRNVEIEELMQKVEDQYHVSGFNLTQGIFKIKSFTTVETGGMVDANLYDIVVDCEGTDLHVLVSQYLPAMAELKKGRYLNVSGMLVGMVLPEEDLRHTKADVEKAMKKAAN